MALNIHILLILTALLLTVVACIRFGTRPNLRRVLTGFVVAFFCVILQCILATPYRAEGGSSPLPLFVAGCVWLVASLVASERKSLGLSMVVFALFMGATWQHPLLGASAAYTDNPSGRRSAIVAYNRRAAKAGRPLSPPIQIKEHWYTVLTGLYSVEPPTNIHPSRPA